MTRKSGGTADAHTSVMSFHAAVWLDHEQAKIFEIQKEFYGETTLTARSAAQRDEKAFHGAIVSALDGAQEILVMGPGTAKTAFMRYVHKNAPRLEPRIVGVESADHPTEGQIVAHVRKYFRAKDRMLGNLI